MAWLRIRRDFQAEGTTLQMPLTVKELGILEEVQHGWIVENKGQGRKR